ncbi:Vacuolar protein sorting-associated protein 11 [Hypsizygus marmoreus]|uniref:E3 ubiquitin-protein ligase PEP5 n=1 Tax=Hypsizygus marmoreus TaxID=39966 RepID=A0A369JTP5_HYPMA|nr:Vacuolar protein sorting-associated protein 11 [Hypsizygus marmoreus]
MSTLAAATASATAGAGSAPAWRHYPFFDVVPVKDVHDLNSSPDIFRATLEISTVASSSAGVLVADIHGSVHILNKDFESIASWVAHVGGRVTHMVERKGVLVTLGEEDAVRSPLLKMWDVINLDKKTGAPILLRSTKVQLNNRPHPVSTIALSASLSHLAIGLGDGTVLLYRHLDQSLSSSTSLTSLPKPRMLHESGADPITGLGFKESTEESPNTYLFVVTLNQVIAYQVSGKGSGGTGAVVDEIGCGLGCATMDWRAGNVVVARDEAIFVCGTEGRGACYAYEGHKSSIYTHLNYLVIVSPPFIPSASAASATVRNFVARTPGSGESDITKVTVFEPENKYIAYSGTFTHDVREVISQWGQIYILTSDGNLLCLQEKSTATKLDLLYRKSLYGLALSLAKTQRLDEESVADIHKQYGDHLYAKGDYDNAMQQFVQTIGHLQPSYVIRKFLDAQRIHNLVTYLQELHSLGVANADHTTLLLNTYTKLKDVTRLDNFIKTESRREGDELPFDLETAIRVCRQAGYFEHASYLARKYERHEDYLRIQIEDAGRYSDALSYLRKLGPEAAESNLARYGRAMLESLPGETTQLLIDLCTTTSNILTETDEPPSSAVVTHKGPSYLSYLALNRPSAIVPTVVSSSDNTATPPSPSIKTVKPETASRGDSVPSRPPTPPPSAPPTATVAVGPPPVKRLSPRIYFAHFVDHMEWFLVFLETVALRRWGQSVDEAQKAEAPVDGLPVPPVDEEEDRLDQIAVWNTLLELYLTLPGKDSGEVDVLRGKAMRVLTSGSIPYDPMHALILCSSRGYTAGLVLLWERMGMYEDVLRFWIDRHNDGTAPDASGQVIAHLDKYGSAHPHLYTLVLRFLTSTPELLARHTEDVRRVLGVIDEEEILPPMGVVRVLSRNGVASVGLVKEWLIGRIKTARAEIQEDRQLITSYRLETAAKLKQVEELSDSEHPRVFHVTRCSACAGQLDLPSIHFMCNHSYHQRCLAENEVECPNCAREHSVIREIRRNNERLADQHDVFLSEVQDGGFEAVAAAFGRGFLNTARP